MYIEKIIEKISWAIATCFGIGFLFRKIMPGTIMSAVATLMIWFIPIDSLYTFVGIILLLILCGWWASSYLSQLLGEHDASCIVVDELIGMMISLLYAPKLVWWYILVFLLFRFFDIVKPFPISFLDKKIRNGLGIIADDCFAAFYTQLSILFIYKVYLFSNGWNLF
jgi:phosphatidylglycerophosphatase A